MAVQFEVTSIDGMVSQLVTLIAKGYRYYFTGVIKAGQDVARIDEKMQALYEADVPKWTRERRKKKGLSNFRYLRCESWFIVLATEGRAPKFWKDDAHRIRDVREVPIRFKGYSVSYRKGGWKNRKLWQDPNVREKDMKWHVRVQLDRDTYAGIKAYFLNLASHREKTFIEEEIFGLPFQPYRPVREQMFCIVRAVNKARRAAGYERIRASSIRFKREIVKVFEPPESMASEIVDQ